jgi:hypothetical protein
MYVFTAGNRHKQNSRTAKKFVSITSGFGGGEFTKTLRKVCTCQKLKLAFYCSNIAILCPLSGDARIQGKEEKRTDIDSLQKTISI